MKHNFGLFYPQLFPSLTWRKCVREKTVFLTFDDGPIPEVTEWVLEELSRQEVRATFFCVGDNIRKYPEIYERVLQAGHSTGNHTFNHVNGRKAMQENYFENISKCDQYMTFRDRKRLFRPPYGKLTFSEIRRLRKNYEIIMWDVLSRDFDPNISQNDCLKASLKYTRPGSIIVFHDNVKSFETVKSVLPRYISDLKSRGYSFDVL